MGLLGACYLAFSLVVYRYCGVWIASPALGSAGPLIKKISYGIALPGLLISATLCQHLAAKYLFVRLLKGTEHLQGRTKTHWATWIGSTVGCGVFAFVICGAVPFFGSLIGLIGAIAYAPMAVSSSNPRKTDTNIRSSSRCISGYMTSVIAVKNHLLGK